MGRARARGPCYQLKPSAKDWAHLAKIAIWGIVDFWQFCKKGQLHQCITSSILTLWRCSWTFYKAWDVLWVTRLVSSQLSLPSSCMKLWQKRYFCWLFKMTYNVQIHNFLWVHILNLGAEDGLHIIASSSKWALD